MKPLSFNEPPATDVPPAAVRGDRRRRPLLIVVALVLVALIMWGAIRLLTPAEKTAPPPAPVQVALAPVEEKDMAVYIAGVGTVTPNQSVTVKARVDGQLQTLGYREGQDVKAGQLIAQIDPRPFQAQYAQAQATRGKDAALLANARLDLRRYQDLIKEEATSQQQLDTQKSLVAQLEAAVKTDEAQAAYAKTQLDYTTITAPISGRTGLRLVDVGNIVHAADTTGIVVIDQIDPITVLFTLPDAAFQRVNAAMRAAVQANASPPAALAYTRDDATKPIASGRLVLVDNHIDTTSGTVQIKAAFDNANHALWPGQYVNVRLYTENRKRALVIPAAGVQRSQKGTFAFVAGAGDKAEMVPIDVALIQDGQAIVDRGLAPGQRVVVDGVYKVKPGVKLAATQGAQRQAPASGGGATAASASGNPAERAAPPAPADQRTAK